MASAPTPEQIEVYVDAARAMGMTESQTLFRVEVPVALPVILGGIPGRRAATGRGVAIATAEAMNTLGMPIKGAQAIVQALKRGLVSLEELE